MDRLQQRNIRRSNAGFHDEGCICHSQCSTPERKLTVKKILLTTAMIPLIALGGCAGLTQANVASTVASIEASVQADSNLVCGFVPTIATIASFIPTVGAIATDAASIAESICSAVATAPPVTVQSARLRSLKMGGKLGAAVNVATVNVPGVGPVPISGKFTR
jgi:hypothetical protein